MFYREFGANAHPCGQVKIGEAEYPFRTGLRRTAAQIHAIEEFVSGGVGRFDRKPDESYQDFDARVRGYYVDLLCIVIGEGPRQALSSADDYPLGELMSLWAYVSNPKAVEASEAGENPLMALLRTSEPESSASTGPESAPVSPPAAASRKLRLGKQRANTLSP